MGCVAAVLETSGIVDAILLPVYEDGYLRTLSVRRNGPSAFFERMSDLVAIPMDGGRCVSLNGTAAAIGGFAPNESGRVTLYASGRAWLTSHLARAKTLAEEMPAHLVPAALGAPEDAATLVIAPDALEWRPWRAMYALPKTAKEILCADSRGLAQLIDAAQRKRETCPKVLVAKDGAA